MATKLRMRATGILDLVATSMSIRIGGVPNIAVLTGAVQVEPGIFEVDFSLPAGLNGAGDQPIVLQSLISSSLFSSRLDDTAPRVSIL